MIQRTSPLLRGVAWCPTLPPESNSTFESAVVGVFADIPLSRYQFRRSHPPQVATTLSFGLVPHVGVVRLYVTVFDQTV